MYKLPLAFRAGRWFNLPTFTNLFQQQRRTTMLRQPFWTLTLLACMAVAVEGRVLAQQPEFKLPQPGPEHKVLEPLIGTWNAKVKFWLDPTQPPQESEGVMKRKWIMDGRFVEEKYEGKALGASFQGMGLTGYDPLKKKYVGTWVDSMSCSIMVSQGDYDAKTKTLTSTSDDINPYTGLKTKSRDVLRLVSDDHHLLEMYQTPEGGKEMKVMEIHYHRVKK
jgi:hypothetical protein